MKLHFEKSAISCRCYLPETGHRVVPLSKAETGIGEGRSDALHPNDCAITYRFPRAASKLHSDS
ncbi:MAG TPA: hypothetical protein PLL95_13095, partial [Anaerolineales bacterium]|nr:hypothetical protein [Anaerolineales bacterium]